MPCPHFLQITTLLLGAYAFPNLSGEGAKDLWQDQSLLDLPSGPFYCPNFTYIVYVPKKAVKGQALADFFLAAHPLPPDSNLNDYLPDEPVFHIETFPY